MTGVIKTTGNIRIFCLCVFLVMYGNNQSYSLECDWGRISPYSRQKVKVRASESGGFKGIRAKE